MRTPDEIKDRLASAIPFHLHPGDPEPRLTPRKLLALEELMADALAYIQQLEADNAQLNRCIENMTNMLNVANDALPRWIPVEERLPETCEETRSFYHSVTVLALKKGRIMMGYFTTSKDDGSWCFSGFDDWAKPTHWMPIPETPKEEHEE